MKVAVVEDHVMFNEFLCKACRTHIGFAFVAAAFTAASAMTLLQQGGYTLMLLDIQLPDMNGFDFALDALRLAPLLKIIGVSAYCNEYAVHRLSQSPLHGFVDKSMGSLQELWRAIAAVEQGGKYYSPSVLSIRRRLSLAPDSFSKLLSAREIAVLCQVGNGNTDAQVGETLGISAATVKWHRKQLMHKLELRNHTELVIYANKSGFSAHF